MNEIFIDVRESFEYAAGHVKGAVNIPLSQIMSRSSKLDNIPKDAQVVLYCQSGSRADYALSVMEDLGYTNLTNGVNKSHVESNYEV